MKLLCLIIIAACLVGPRMLHWLAPLNDTAIGISYAWLGVIPCILFLLFGKK